MRWSDRRQSEQALKNVEKEERSQGGTCLGTRVRSYGTRVPWYSSTYHGTNGTRVPWYYATNLVRTQVPMVQSFLRDIQ
jgi:hypothetical protein